MYSVPLLLVDWPGRVTKEGAVSEGNITPDILQKSFIKWACTSTERNFLLPLCRNGSWSRMPSTHFRKKIELPLTQVLLCKALLLIV